MLPGAGMEDPDWRRAASLFRSVEKLDPSEGSRRVVVLGAPLQVSISPSQAERTPHAVRTALEGLASYDAVTRRDLGEVDWVDLGDASLPGTGPQEDSDTLGREIIRLLNESLAPSDLLLLVGGDNGVTLPGVCSVANPIERTGLITIDAHHDVRTRYRGLTNGTPVRDLIDAGLPGRQVIQIGISDFGNSAVYRQWADEQGIRVVPLDAIDPRAVQKLAAEALEGFPPHVEQIYLDVDVDVLDAAYAPACPGARPGGMDPRTCLRLIRAIVADPRVVAVDFVEVDASTDERGRTVQFVALAMLTAGAAFVARGSAGT